MGQGATLTVTNNRKKPVQLLVQNVKCMFDGGEQGSNLQVFNNVTIQPKGTVPAGGPQYIEDVDSGIPCAFDTATFNLIIQEVGGSVLGTVFVSESQRNYSASVSNADLLSAFVSNHSGGNDVAAIQVSVMG